jgi:opacity protein-like surface antigen
MKIVLCFLLSSVTAFPQFFAIGVKGGVPVTDAFKTATTRDLSYLSNTKRYTVGPTVELRLPFGLGVEFDALYKRLNYESVQEVGPAQIQANTSASSWEFPLLLKLRAPAPLLRPYLTVGPSFRHISDVTQAISSFVGGTQQQTNQPAELQNRFNAGFAIGGGLEFGGGHFRVSPEIRYTRWGWENFQASNVPGFQSNQNQVDFLLGITF